MNRPFAYLAASFALLVAFAATVHASVGAQLSTGVGGVVIVSGGVLTLDSGSLSSASEAGSGVRKAANFETAAVGAGKLIKSANPRTNFDFTGSLRVGDASAVLGATDALTGIVAESPLGDGQAAYLGGAGTSLVLPAEPTALQLSVWQGISGEPVVDILRKEFVPFGSLLSGTGAYLTPIVRVSADFAVSRFGGGANQQSLTFSLRDERDAADSATLALHSRVRVNADNSVSIADHEDSEFAASGLTLESGVGYRVAITADYNFAVWSAAIERLDTGERTVLASRRALNTDGFVLSPWVIPGSFDITLDAVGSVSNKAFADRFYLDNIHGATITRPVAPAVHAFEFLGVGAGGLLTWINPPYALSGPGGTSVAPFSGYSGRASHSDTSVDLGSPATDAIQGIVAESPLGTGRALYLGGAGTTLSLPETPGAFSVAVFPGKATDEAVNAADSEHPFRRFEADFYLDRQAQLPDTHAQTLTFSVVDARDQADSSTSALHSRVRIYPGNGVWIADHADDFVATDVTLDSATAYHLEVEVDYEAATWSATIRARDGSATHVLATDRPIDSDDFTLSGWVTRGLVEIEHCATASASDKALPDRFYVDNLVVSDGSASLDAFKPFFVIAPADRQFFAGTPHTFRGEAVGEPAPAYQWFRNDEPVSDATQPALAVVTPDFGGDADYSIAATNGSGTAVRTADLTVLPPLAAPAFTTQPESLIAAVGQAVSFTVAVTGNPAPTLQWRRNGKAITGATSATYAFTAAASLAGVYDVVATNSQGTATSESATLSLPAAPRITEQPRSQTVDAGASVTFTVVATGRPTNFSYTWMRDGQPLGAADSPTLTLPSVARADAGRYTVSVSNGVGKPALSAAAKLAVRFPPEILVPPAGATVLAGAKVTLRVTAAATPPLSYQWRFNGQPIVGARASTYMFVAALARAGDYDVVVTNALGSATSSVASVVVQAAPKFTTQPVAVGVDPGASAQLSAVASGFPAPSYQWYRNGEPVEGATGSTLAFDSVTSAEAGTYTVVATNTLGTATSSTARLALNIAPEAMTTGRKFTLAGTFRAKGGSTSGVNETYTMTGATTLAYYDYYEGIGLAMTYTYLRTGPDTARLVARGNVIPGKTVTLTFDYTFVTATSGTYQMSLSSNFGYSGTQSGGFTLSTP